MSSGSCGILARAIVGRHAQEYQESHRITLTFAHQIIQALAFAPATERVSTPQILVDAANEVIDEAEHVIVDDDVCIFLRRIRVRFFDVKRRLISSSERISFGSIDTREHKEYTLYEEGDRLMRTQSPDTSPEAESRLIERIRLAPVSRRFRLVHSLSQRMLAHRDADQAIQTQAIHAITVGYGQRIGQRVRAALAARPEWQEQPVDLTATILPVMQAFQKAGISSYLGGSIASSIHGMQQSASDIDLTLISQGQSFLPVGAALAPLCDQYLVEPEVIAQGLREGTSCSLIHVATLMKIDLILPRPSAFDTAMQARIVSVLIDERYAPFPLASALEMVTWKLARCATELASSTDGRINDAEWNDVLGMLKVQGTTLDLTQMNSWTQVLHAGHLLPQALDDAGLVSDEETSPQRLAG